MSVVLVTGTSSGFGRAIATRFAGQGDHVIATMRNADVADPEFAGQPGVEVVEMDVTDEDGRRRVVDRALAEHGRIDVLVNNAGVGSHSAAEEHPADDARLIMETNFWGPLELTRLVLPQMRRRASGRIINVTSAGIYITPPFLGIYTASKLAADGLSASMDTELQGTGVRVVSVLPGPHDTGIQHRVDAHVEEDSPYRSRLETFRDGFMVSVASNPDLAPVVDAVMAAAEEADPPARLLVGGPLHDLLLPSVNAGNRLTGLFRDSPNAG